MESETKILKEARSRISRHLDQVPEGALTTEQLAEQLGVGTTTVKHFLNAVRAEGKLKEARVRLKRNGYNVSIKVYWME